MRAATVVFGRRATVHADPAGYEPLVDAWRAAMGERCEAGAASGHDVFLLTPARRAGDGGWELDALFGLELPWDQQVRRELLAGLEVTRAHETAVDNVGGDLASIPQAWKALLERVRKARRGPLSTVRLEAVGKETTVHLIAGGGVPWARLFYGGLLAAPLARPPGGAVATLELGDRVVAGYELAHLAGGATEALAAITTRNGDYKVCSKSTYDLARRLAKDLGGLTASAIDDFVLVHPPGAGPGHLRLGAEAVGTREDEASYVFAVDGEATAWFTVGRRFERVVLSAERGRRLDALIDGAAAASGLRLRWLVAGDGGELQTQLEAVGHAAARTVVVGQTLAVADGGGPSEAVPVEQARAALVGLREVIEEPFWVAVADALGWAGEAHGEDASGADQLLVVATGALASAFLAYGRLVTRQVGEAQGDGAFVGGNGMDQLRQATVVLGERVAGHHFELAQTPAEPVPMAALDALRSQDGAALYVVASFD